MQKKALKMILLLQREPLSLYLNKCVKFQSLRTTTKHLTCNKVRITSDPFRSSRNTASAAGINPVCKPNGPKA